MKKFLFLLTFLIVCGIMASNVFAQVQAGKFSVSPFIGGYSFDSDTNLKTKPVYGLRAGYDITEHWGVEGALDYVATKVKNGGGDADVFGYRLDGLYHFMPSSKLVPFLAVGAGGTTTDFSGSRKSETDALINYGGGIKYFLTEALALRADIRQLWVFDGGRKDWEYTAGLTYVFGAKKQVTAPVAPAIVEVDTDEDGVVDSKDKCPGTPKSISVDKDGCPKDSDGDGVTDYIDKCPDTPKGVKVDFYGCPPQEKAQEKAAAIVKAPEKISISLEIEFDTAKANIKPKYHEKIKKVADFMTTYPETTAVIEGHTDNVGSEASNLKLSAKRAESVKQYLVNKFKIDPKRLSTKGYGESQPIADNSTAEGRQKNRRINAVITGTK